MIKKHSKLVTLLFLFGIFILIMFTYVQANNERQVLKEDYVAYIQSFDEQGVLQPNENMKFLVEKYPDDYLLNYYYGFGLVQQTHYKNASIYYQKALDLNPYLVEKPEFMYQFSLILANLDRESEAKETLSIAEKFAVNESTVSAINDLKQQIERGK